jgi:hypothetical protein
MKNNVRDGLITRHHHKGIRDGLITHHHHKGIRDGLITRHHHKGIRDVVNSILCCSLCIHKNL